MVDRPELRQDDWAIRFEWGPAGVEAVTSDAVVVVDVLRFTTAVDAAVGRGAVVLPYRERDDAAAAYAASVGAALAGAGTASALSLSPVSLLSLAPRERVVLPSPNGSTCAAVGAATGATVVAACLRNAAAVAAWLRGRAETVTVVACGERWPDGSLRPSLEDHLGAGAVIAALGGSRSPEAEAAAAVWATVGPRAADTVASCVSGRELAARGATEDVEFAVQLGASRCVPVLGDGFVDAATTTTGVPSC